MFYLEFYVVWEYLLIMFLFLVVWYFLKIDVVKLNGIYGNEVFIFYNCLFFENVNVRNFLFDMMKFY